MGLVAILVRLGVAVMLLPENWCWGGFGGCWVGGLGWVCWLSVIGGAVVWFPVCVGCFGVLVWWFCWCRLAFCGFPVVWVLVGSIGGCCGVFVVV